MKVDVRIVAATHQNLERLVAEGAFREDLFHRLNVIRVHLPALRERREDIPQLARHFLARAAHELGVEAKTLRPDTERFFMGYPWQGNVRQLENTCRWLTVMASGQDIHVEDLPPELRSNESPLAVSGDWRAAFRDWADRALAAGHTHLLEEAVPDFERILIETALRHTGGRKGEAAELLGWGRNTLTRKLKTLLPALAEGE
jgi:two-component system nitrogen regulation response regulator GlnG